MQRGLRLQRWGNDHVLQARFDHSGSFSRLPPSAAALKLILIMLIFTGRFTSSHDRLAESAGISPIGRATCRWVSVGTDRNINPSLNFPVEPMISVPAATAVHSVG
jgi:hypothetical protein